MASKYLQKYPVPEGFNEILHNLTREVKIVLRDQPEDIIAYAAEYFECLATGKQMQFVSKFNIAQNQKQYHKTYNPKTANDLANQAKYVVDRSSNQHGERIASGKSNQNDLSKGSSLESYADEKKATKQFVNELYGKALNNIVNEEAEDYQQLEQEIEEKQFEQGQQEPIEQVDQEKEEEPIALDQFVTVDDKDMQNIVKIQSRIRGGAVRLKTKQSKK